MMYAVKTYKTGVLMSWHQETPAGLAMAIEESNMRTHAHGVPHMVTDNHGLRLHLSLPVDVQKKLDEQRKNTRIDRVLSWLGFALLLVAVLYRR